MRTFSVLLQSWSRRITSRIKGREDMKDGHQNPAVRSDVVEPVDEVEQREDGGENDP